MLEILPSGGTVSARRRFSSPSLETLRRCHTRCWKAAAAAPAECLPFTPNPTPPPPGRTTRPPILHPSGTCTPSRPPSRVPPRPPGPAGSSEDASEHHNVFFGHDFQLEQHSGRRSPSIAAYRHDCHRDSAYFSTDESTEPGAGPDILPRGPSPPFSSAFLREAIQHSLADSLHRLPEIVASEVSRQVRECLRDSTSEVAAELHKLSSTNTGSESLGPKRPSSLDLLGSPRRRHIYSYSCQDLLGDDPFPLALSHSRRSSRAGATLSVVDLDSSSDDQMCSKGVSASHWNQTTSEPSHLHHLHLEHAVAQVEVEGDVVELPFKHHQHLKEALTPLCRELSQSHLLDGKGRGGGGQHECGVAAASGRRPAGRQPERYLHGVGLLRPARR
ncbi:uncharacterized protein LOC135112713 [Scylla paramamosain]|uniref:uncharacterized protein LOC135112713 n=1 Tax=Scylla paramamosain TaxID=85552 RepID=UPI003082DA68